MKQLLTIFILLLTLVCCTSEAERSSMRAGLDSINERNRNDQPFTVADVEPFVQFFDDHGTPNDRLLAYYLLGRAYHDHGEAPMALECYQKAADCADTLSTDCDYPQLARVYGQMAQIFYEQGLYRQELVHIDLSVKYAWKGKDTLLALGNYEQKYSVYNRLCYIDSAIFIIEDVANKYDQFDRSVNSAISLGLAIRPLIDRGNFQKAKAYMDIYETQSGRFDSLGNIESGREIYYRSKGLYFLRANKIDSAEYYFRKELYDGKDFNNQHSAALGLAELYHIRQISDSSSKYYEYAYEMSDSLYARRTTKEVERIQSMYNYTRHQAIAYQESRNAATANIRFLVTVVVLLIVLLFASWLYIARRKVIESLERTASELHQIKAENHLLRQDAVTNQQQITDNEKRIKQLEKKLGKYGKLVFFGSEKMENDMKQSPNYQQIEKFAHKGQKLSESDWDTVYNLIAEYYPGCYDFLLSRLQIDSIEYRICLLLRLHFKTGEIAYMLGFTPPYISKTSTEILGNLYGKKGSSKELSKELGKIN